MTIFQTLFRRFLLTSVLWTVFWPILWFIKIGDITGPKAWFWIIGELSYPIVAIVYIILDLTLKHLGARPWVIFTVAVLLIVIAMPFYYERYGFTLGVTLEARYL